MSSLRENRLVSVKLSHVVMSNSIRVGAYLANELSKLSGAQLALLILD